MSKKDENSSSSSMPSGGGFRGPGRGGGMPVQKAKNFKGTFRRLLGYMRPHKAQLSLVFLMAALSTIFTIYSPKVIGHATTSLFTSMMQMIKKVPGAHVDFHYLLQILLLLAALYVFSSFFNYLQQYVMAGVSQKIVYTLRKSINAKLSRLPLKYFDSRSHGEIMSRVVNDMEYISNTLQQSLTQVVTSIVTIIGIIIMMLTINFWMTLIVLLTLPLSIFTATMIATRSQKFFRQQRTALGKVNGYVEEMYAGHEIVKAFGHENMAIDHFDGLNEELRSSGRKALFVSSLIWPLMNFIGNIGYVFICVVGGVMVTHGTIQVGDIQAFIQYARQFTQPITQAANIVNQIQSTIASAERVFEILDEEEEVPEAAEAEVISSARGDVEFLDVKFGYKPDVTLIDHMNIDVQAGQTIAIVGPTGAGKTTLVNLLMRFYEVDGGKITIDGVDINDLSRRNLHNIFGMVLQDTWLFNGTIRDNIAYGRENASEAEIVRAAETAHADHFIRTLPNGYDTVLNEEGSNISQGQKQLLTIARAVLADPAILILDEATSSVDTRTEVQIQHAMNQLMEGRTNFVIAHRLSTIRGANSILVMNHGRIIEHGSHEELLEQDGFYADLYNSQFTGGTAQDAV